MDPNSAVIHAQCRKELVSQREDYEMTISALMHQRTQLRKEKDNVTQQRNTLEAALDKSRSDIDRTRHERDSIQQTEKSSRAKFKNDISRLREAVSSIQADRDQSQIEYSRQNKRVLYLTQDNNKLSQQLESHTNDIQRREQEAEILICELDRAQRAYEELSRDKRACGENRMRLEGELGGSRQGLQDTLKNQIDAISLATESADYKQKERLRSVTRELSRVLESVVMSSSASSDTHSSYSVTASRDEIPGSGGVLGGQIDLRSLLEEVQPRGKGSSLSIGAVSRSRSSSLTGSEKKLTERLNTELCKFKEQKDSLSMKVSDLKAENQSISEKLLRENRQNELHRAEIQELQRRYEQSVCRLEKKEQETIRLNGELDKIKSERDNRVVVPDDITAFERENPFSSHLISQWPQDMTSCMHDENSFTMVSELTDPTLAGLSTCMAVNDTNAVFQAQIDETITSNLPPRIVPYSVQGPSPELDTDEPVPQESPESAVSRLKEEREQLEQKLLSAELDNRDLRTQLSQASERRPASQLFERISQMETEKQKLITENNQLRDEIRYRCPSGGEGLQEKNEHLSSKLVEAVRLLESNNKEKKNLILNLFGPEANTATTMSDVTRRVDQMLSEKQALTTAVDILSTQLRSVEDEADSYQTAESLRGEVAVLKERVLAAEADNVELTQHLADMVRERDMRQQAVTQTETVCRELKLKSEKLTLVKAQLEAEHDDVSAELLLAREGYRQVVEERDNLALQNEQIMAQYHDALECKERVVEEHAVTLAQMDGFWRLKADLEAPRSRTPTHIWGGGWDRKTLVLQLSSKKDPDIYLAGGKGQPLLPNPNAVIVVDVLPSSPACYLLQPGDVIESIDGCDCSILTKTEVIGKMQESTNSSLEVVLLRRRGPHKLLVIPDVDGKPSTNRIHHSSSRNQLSASASFPGSRSPCLTPEPSEFLLNSKISQVSLTSSLTSNTDLQKLVNRASNPLMHSLTEQLDIVLLANRDSKRGFGFSYSWESQFIVSALTKTGAANSQLTPGDKIVRVNGVSVMQAKPSSVKRLIKHNKNVLKLSIVRTVIPGSSNVHLANQDIFSDTEVIENPILHKKANFLAQEKDYYSAGESKTEEKGFIRNRLSLMRSKKRRKSSVPVPVESDTEEPHPPSGPVSALGKIKAVRVMRLRKKQSSFRDDLESHREESGEERKTYEDTRHPLHGLAVEEVFEERKVDCPTPPANTSGSLAPETTPQTHVKIQPHTPTQLELSCEEDRVNSPGFLLARDASGRTTFRNLPDLDRKLANKRHSLTSAPVINCSTSESTEALQPECVSRSAELFILKNEHSQVGGSVGETMLAAQEHHQPQSELGLDSENTTFPPFRSISPISLQRSLTEKKTVDHLTGESSAIDSFLDEARALVCPEQQLPVPSWHDIPPVPEFIRANFTIQGHQFLTVTEGAVYQILETTPSHLNGFMLVAPVFPEEMHVKEGYVPTEKTGKEMLQNLKPSLDLRRLKVYSPVKLYKGPRPVLVFGPLSGEIGQQLEKAYSPEFVVCPKAFVRANDEQMKDQLCNDIAKGLILDLTANSQKSYMFFELDYIQLQIADGKHSILNSSPKIIGQLKEKGIPPISILIKARSPNTIMSFSSRNLTEKDCVQMFQAFEHIEVDLEPNLHASLMLVKMPVLVEQIREVIQREQNLPVWMNV